MAFTEGYFVFLEPLPVGNHGVDLKVSVLNPIEPTTTITPTIPIT